MPKIELCQCCKKAPVAAVFPLVAGGNAHLCNYCATVMEEKIALPAEQHA